MSQIDTRGGGGGPKCSEKLTRIIWMAPKSNYCGKEFLNGPFVAIQVF
jgi:hypothetical protein